MSLAQVIPLTTPVPKNLKIVILENPYAQIRDPKVRDLLGRIFALKLEGYQAVYPDGILPVDGYDLIATHHLVCEETQGGLTPVMGYKSITLDRCIHHRLSFPGLGVLRVSPGTEAHQASLQAILDRCSRQGIPISYGSSWTIAPAYRERKDLKYLLKDLLTVMLVWSEREYQIPERICCGAIKVRTDEYFLAVGYKPIHSGDGRSLPAFPQYTLFDEEAVMLHCTEFSKQALTLAERYRALWENRLVLAPQVSERKRRQAA